MFFPLPLLWNSRGIKYCFIKTEEKYTVLSVRKRVRLSVWRVAKCASNSQNGFFVYISCPCRPTDLTLFCKFMHAYLFICVFMLVCDCVRLQSFFQREGEKFLFFRSCCQMTYAAKKIMI